MGPVYAGILGSLAFVLALTRGLVDGGSADHTLSTAGACLLVFALVGYLSGRVADQVLWESVRRRFQDEMRSRATRD
jgi:hypothetical protein